MQRTGKHVYALGKTPDLVNGSQSAALAALYQNRGDFKRATGVGAGSTGVILRTFNKHTSLFNTVSRAAGAVY